MSAAELLRSLDKAATAGEWVSDNPHLHDADVRTDGGDIIVCERPDPAYYGHKLWSDNARLIATTRNLLPELAALVEAVDAYICADGDRTFAAMVGAMDALNAKAAELGGK